MDQLFKQRHEKLGVFKRLRRKEIQLTPNQVPEELYMKCDGCNRLLLQSDVKNNLFVCPHCDCHLSLSAWERLVQICDSNSFVEYFQTKQHANPLAFPGYEEKIKGYQQKTKMDEAIVCGKATIHQEPCCIAVMDAQFLMGSMGTVVGEKLTRLIEHATRKRLPLIVFCASGGARMQEGIYSLMQMAKTSAALQKHDAAGLLYLSVLTHPTYGGVSASFAMLGDVILAEPQASIGFAGKRVIEQTIHQTLPEDFQSAKALMETGFVDDIVHRNKMKATLGFLLKAHARVKC
ncbi:MAG: acetyl-CoA carboxylase, carboxyltransferase subunit beta [Erysipelotrichaceae bacterium]